MADIVVGADRPWVDCRVGEGEEPMALRTVLVVEDTPVVGLIALVEDTSRDRHILWLAAIVAYSRGLADWLVVPVFPADYFANQNWVNSYHTDFDCSYICNLILSCIFPCCHTPIIHDEGDDSNHCQSHKRNAYTATCSHIHSIHCFVRIGRLNSNQISHAWRYAPTVHLYFA